MTAGSTDPRGDDAPTKAWSELLREKRSLAAIVRDAGRLCIQDSVDLVLDVCDELANAHANGIVHGDLGLHRVRTMWPRRPGDHVDIWTLDADDTGAIDFRAAFQAPALAPEQRAGKIGDKRSDIWAVGAILHTLIGGQPPSRRPPREVLAGIPRALLTCIEQCLADSPDDRPVSLDDVAGMLASYASNSPERFQQLARRRIAGLKAKHVGEKVAALGRLDESAVRRASEDRILAVQPMKAAEVISDGFSSSMPAAPVQASPDAYAQAHVHPIPRQPSGTARTSESVAFQPMRAAAPAGPEALYPPAPSVLPPAPQQPYAMSPSALPPAMVAYEAPTRGRANATPPMIQPIRAARPQMPSDPSVSVEWPAMHGAQSTSLHVDSKDLPTVTAPPQPFPAAALNPNVTQRIAASSAMPFLAAPKIPSAPKVPSFGPAPVTPTPAVIVSFDDPPARWSAPSYHPTSIPPMSIDASDPVIPGLRAPSFSDLAEYREAKRTSRRNATWAVFVAAAVIVLGLGFGSRMLAEDRAAMRAAAVQAAAPPPPAPVEKAAPPVAAQAAPPVAVASAAASATPAPKAKGKGKHHRRHAAGTAPAASDEPADDNTSPSDLLNSGLGKHDTASPDALSDALK
jgi:serine/threonine-protein kinase